MKKVVCVVGGNIFVVTGNHIHLEYGKTYEIMGEGPTSIRVLGLDGWWNKKLFVSLEEFRQEQIEKILE